MVKIQEKEIKRLGRHNRIRKKVVGTTAQPRVCLHRSLKNIYVQVVDDVLQKVLFGMSTMSPDVKAKVAYGGNVNAASTLGEMFAAEAKKRGITKVCFDRGGYFYHGRVKAFAEAARKGGMEF